MNQIAALSRAAALAGALACGLPACDDESNEQTSADAMVDVEMGDAGVDPVPDAEMSDGPDMATSPDMNIAPDMMVEPPVCLEDTTGNFGDPGATELNIEIVADGLSIPWGLDWLPDGAMLVTQRSGDILRVNTDGELQAEPVATVPITPSGEGGLLGLAIHPDVATNGWIYIYATVGRGNTLRNEVQRWVLNEAATSATFESVIVADIPALLFHNGGRLRFGPDGHLYVGTGDAGEPGLSQDVSSLGGKLLRVTDEGMVPDDNPFPGEAAYLIGVRNTQGFDWRADGTIVITDHGPSGLPAELGRTDYDEINVVAPGDNLGWPDIYQCETAEGMQTPRKTWARAMPPGGTAIYTGDSLPWQGDVFIGVLGFEADVGHLHRISLDASGNVTASETYLRGDEGYGRLREVVMGPDGHLYVTTSNCDGRGECGAGDLILRLSAP
ncbi:MAG: PQQ-dependent sugar dehydrogenase [Bradymonadia bacterium]